MISSTLLSLPQSAKEIKGSLRSEFHAHVVVLIAVIRTAFHGETRTGPAEITQRAGILTVKVTTIVCPAIGDMFGKVRCWIGAVDLSINGGVGRVEENPRRAVDAWRWKSVPCSKYKGRAAGKSGEAVRCAKKCLWQLTDGNPSRRLVVECAQLVELYGCPPCIGVGSEIGGRIGTLAAEHAWK